MGSRKEREWYGKAGVGGRFLKNKRFFRVGKTFCSKKYFLNASFTVSAASTWSASTLWLSQELLPEKVCSPLEQQFVLLAVNPGPQNS
jgi:hypothetical protein